MFSSSPSPYKSVIIIVMHMTSILKVLKVVQMGVKITPETVQSASPVVTLPEVFNGDSLKKTHRCYRGLCQLKPQMQLSVCPCFQGFLTTKSSCQWAQHGHVCLSARKLPIFPEGNTAVLLL